MRDELWQSSDQDRYNAVEWTKSYLDNHFSHKVCDFCEEYPLIESGEWLEDKSGKQYFVCDAECKKCLLIKVAYKQM